MAGGRELCLRMIAEHLGVTRAGRELGLQRLTSLADLRASLPIRDRETHEKEVEARLGFVIVDIRDENAQALSGSDRERGHVVGIWRAYLGGEAPQRVGLLRGRNVDPAVDAVMVDDLRALGGELLRIDRLDDPEVALERLEQFGPDLLVVPSALTCRALESVHGAPLERRLRRLRLVLAEHDLTRPIRTRVGLRSAGWIHRSGRCGLASVRAPEHAITLAVGTQIIELLPYTNPEEDGRRVYADQTVLPEEAIVGQRYEVVVSSALGFLRSRTDEHVRVVGFDAPAPQSAFARPRVVRLAPAPADVKLEGCTVAGAWLTASIRQALQREDPALVAAEIGPDPLSVPAGAAVLRTGSMRLPDVFKDTELGWMARTGKHRIARKRPRGLLARVELQGHVGPKTASRLSSRIDANLRRRSPAYAYLRERDELDGPRILVVPTGTRLSEEQRRITELVGEVWVPEVRVIEG